MFHWWLLLELICLLCANRSGTLMIMSFLCGSNLHLLSFIKITRHFSCFTYLQPLLKLQETLPHSISMKLLMSLCEFGLLSYRFSFQYTFLFTHMIYPCYSEKQYNGRSNNLQMPVPVAQFIRDWFIWNPQLTKESWPSLAEVVFIQTYKSILGISDPQVVTSRMYTICIFYSVILNISWPEGEDHCEKEKKVNWNVHGAIKLIDFSHIAFEKCHGECV